MEKYGRYALLERIGSGGMAEVYRAVVVGSAGFCRQVAVKRILPHLTRDAEVVAMLIEEARLASSLTHPNIVRVLDLGNEGDSYFIAMDFVAGRTIGECMGRALRLEQALPIPLVLLVVEQALEGLAYAHERRDPFGAPMNIIHRDISPDNVMVAFDGSVFLMDFGIAKAAGRAAVTLAGSLKGKPAYMSPEVVCGEPVTQAVDLYAMGVVLWELLAMRTLRRPQSEMEVFAEVRRGAVPRFDELGRDVPDDVARLVYRALLPAASDRWPDARSFATALRELRMRTAWPWGSRETAEWMGHAFSDELAAERHTERKYHDVINALQRARKRDIAKIIAAFNAGIPYRPSSWRQLAWFGGMAASAAFVSQLSARAADRAPLDAPPPLREIAVVSLPEPVFEVTAPLPASPPPLEPVATSHVEELRSTPSGRRNALHRARQHRAARDERPGRLTLQSTPWARIIIDGTDTAQFTPVTDMPVAPGKHRIELRNDKLGMTTSFVVRIRPGQLLKESRTLK